MQDRLRQNRGQSLLELMVAMSVMTIGFLAIFAVLSQSLGLNKVAANQYAAANLAGEGIEVVKNITDSNVVQGNDRAWNEGLRNGDFGVQYDSTSLEERWKDEKLKFDIATGLYGYEAGEKTNFIRTIKIESISENEVKVNSIVKWQDRAGTDFEINLEDRLFNWH